MLELFDKVENFKAALRLRAILVFFVVHLGLALGIFSLARISFGGWDLTSTLFLASIVLLYGGFIMACLFIALPTLPWIRRYQKAQYWWNTVVEQLPQIILIVKAVAAAWKEASAKKHD